MQKSRAMLCPEIHPMTRPTTPPLPCPAGHAVSGLTRHQPAIAARHHHGFLAMAGLALVLALASPAPLWAQPAATAAPADKTAPKLSPSYFERVEALRDKVSEGKLAEIRATIVPATGHTTVELPEDKPKQTWWQYDDDTTFIHIENTTGQAIAGLEIAFWIDSCSLKSQPPNIVHVLLKKPLRTNAQAVVKIPPSKLLHTKNEVSCLSVRGAWSK